MAELSVAPRRTVEVNTKFDSAASTAAGFPRRTDMSSIAIHPTYYRRAAASVRLTRRGRLVVTVFFLGVLLALFTAFGPRVVATGEQGAPPETSTVVVGDGDTLWGIAADVADSGETREMVRRIVELNALSSATIHPGQELAVPVG
jgi:LysM repeat protein